MSPPGNINTPGRLVLLDASLASGSLLNYRVAVHAFLTWFLSNGYSLNDLASIYTLDSRLTLYLHHLHSTGAGKQKGKNAVFGIIHFLPFCRGKLHYSLKSLRGWERSVPSVPHPPMSYTALVVIAVALAAEGRFDMAVGTLLSFDCLLRVSELTALTTADCTTPNDARLGTSLESTSVSLRLAKTKRGRNQFVSVSSPAVKSLFQRHLRLVPSASRVFSFSPTSFRLHLKRVCQSLSLPPYVPHSLRHGGATYSHLNGLPVEDIMLRGRWESVKSARHYIQSGRALLLTNDIPQSVTSLSRRLSTDLVASVLKARQIAAQH